MKLLHLRPRRNTFSAVFRVRSLAYMQFTKFSGRGFVYVIRPSLGSDAEGAGAMFRVTTLNMDQIPRNERGELIFRKTFLGKKRI